MTRRGSIYVVVLSTVTVVALLGTAGVLAQTRQRQRANSTMDTSRAAAMARSAVELGLQRIAADGSWRTTYGAGAWYDGVAPTGNTRDGTFALVVTGPNGGVLGTDDSDPVELVGTGAFGLASRSVVVSLTSTDAYTPLDCFEVGVHSKRDMVLEFNAAVFGVLGLASAKDIAGSSAIVSVPVEAKGTVTGGVFSAGITSGAAMRTVPSIMAICTDYEADATTIDTRDIPVVSGDYVISDVAIGPGFNPYGDGDTNEQGVYYIDCGRKNIIIENARIVGTLIIRNPGDDSVIRGAVSLQPAIDGYPTLLVCKGSMTFALDATQLSEGGQGVNFNPSGVPDGAGVEDSETYDSYLSAIEGIVHVENDVVFATGTHTNITGHVFAEGTMTFELGSLVRLDDWSEARDNPPPGYRGALLPSELVLGAWSRDLN